MDNPDYESFLRDYYGIIGALPPTTTAQPQKHIERLRALLHLWEAHSFVYNRFSILSTRILDVVHREFTAQELVWTGLEMLNKESTSGSVAPRPARTAAVRRLPARHAVPVPRSAPPALRPGAGGSPDGGHAHGRGHHGPARRSRGRVFRKIYTKGKKVADYEMEGLKLIKNRFHGDWNYTIKPREPREL